MAVLAIDQGTTSTRAFRLQPDGTGQVTHVIEHLQIYPQAGWVEHDPNEIVGNIQNCVAASGKGITAIGIDNQGESCLAWDAQTKQPLSQIIVWQDARTQSEIDRLKAEGFEAETLARAGLPLDPYFSASKLAWLFSALPEARDLLRQGRLRLGTTDAFFLDSLTGRCSTDITTASRTSLLNLEVGAWDPLLCDTFGVPIEALPEIVPTTGDFGSLSVGGKDVPVTASIVDQQAALYGHGCRNTGDSKITFGTGAFALMVTGDSILRAPEQGLLPTVAWQKAGQPPVYALDGGVYCASAAVNWARDLGLFATYDQINSFEAEPAITRGLAFVPALAGLACPHWNRAARGCWLGLTLDTTSRDLMQAVLEGIAFRAAEVVGAMAERVPSDGPLSVDGGMAANPYFRSILAAITGREISVPQSAELTALGCALLAADGAGLGIEVSGAGSIVTSEPLPDQCHARFAQAVAIVTGWN